MKKLTFVFFLLFGVLFANETDMVHKCEVGCKNGNIKYCLALGILYQTGQEGVKQDYSKAAKLFKKACDVGEPIACGQLGVLYYDGKGLKKDISKATNLFKKACNDGEAVSCAQLAKQYLYGEIVEKDVNKAVILFKKACDGGYRPACDVLQRAAKEK